jgi:hypothetical protein
MPTDFASFIHSRFSFALMRIKTRTERASRPFDGLPLRGFLALPMKGILFFVLHKIKV